MLHYCCLRAEVAATSLASLIIDLITLPTKLTPTSVRYFIKHYWKMASESSKPLLELAISQKHNDQPQALPTSSTLSRITNLEER